MKINAFIEVMNNYKNKMLREDQMQAMIAKTLDVKKYLSIKDKKQLVKNIVDECILYVDGVFKFDDIDKYICFIMRTIETYTNIELSDDIEADYDLLCEAELLDPIIGTFKKEYDDINILLQMKCEYMLTNNSLEAQAGRFFDGILERLDVLTNTLSGKVENFDIGKLSFSSEDVTKFLNLFNTQNN